MLGKQTNKSPEKRPPKDNRRHAATTETETGTQSAYVCPVLHKKDNPARAQHSAALWAWRRHRSDHKKRRCPAPCVRFFFGLVLGTQQLQTKKDNGHTNNIKPVKSPKGRSEASPSLPGSMRAKGMTLFSEQPKEIIGRSEGESAPQSHENDNITLVLSRTLYLYLVFAL